MLWVSKASLRIAYSLDFSLNSMTRRCCFSRALLSSTSWVWSRWYSASAEARIWLTSLCILSVTEASLDAAASTSGWLGPKLPDRSLSSCWARMYSSFRSRTVELWMISGISSSGRFDSTAAAMSRYRVSERIRWDSTSMRFWLMALRRSTTMSWVFSRDTMLFPVMKS